MKKITVIVITVLMIIAVAGVGLLLIVRNELREEKLKTRIREIAAENGYSVSMNDIGYSFSFSGLTAFITDADVESKLFKLHAERIYFDLDIWLLIKKQIRFRSINVDNFSLTVFKQKDSVKEAMPGGNLEFSSNILLKNGTAQYDAFNLHDINGRLSLITEDEILAKGEMRFTSGNNYPARFGAINIIFSLSYGDSLIVHKCQYDNGNIIGNASGSLGKGGIHFSTSGHLEDLNIIRQFVNIDDTLLFKGSAEYTADGYYDFGLDYKQNILNLNMAEATLTAETGILNHNISSDKLTLIKQDSAVEYNGRVCIDSTDIPLKGMLMLGPVLEKHISATFNADSINTELLSRFINDVHVKGWVSAEGMINLPFDSINFDYISGSTDAVVYGRTLQAEYDTFTVQIDSVRAFLKQDTLTGVASALYKGVQALAKYSGIVTKRDIRANFSAKGYISRFVNNLNGNFTAKGDLHFKGKTENMIINTGLQISDINNKDWFNDTLNADISIITITGMKKLNMKDARFKGTYIKGKIDNADVSVNNGSYRFDASFIIDSLMLDSLIKPDTTKPNIETKPYELPHNYSGTFRGIIERTEFKKEVLKNLSVKGNLEKGIVNADFEGDMLKGRITGDMKLSFDSKYTSALEFKTENIDAHRFLINHKLFPYEIGGMIFSDSKLEFVKEHVKETVKGNVYVQVKDGWMLAPSLLKEVTNALKYEMSDTFYFETMTGDFDVDTQVVSFDDFYMEKNGHSITYSGWGDFNKNINVKSQYIIDMRIADTGFFEKLLRSTDYESDSVIVNFDITGNFSKPGISMKGNSVGDYLKGQTQQFVDDFINDLNKIFNGK